MNKIENSKIILILSVLLVLLVMGSVSASDELVNETISTPNNNNDNMGVDIQTTTESSGSNDEKVLTADNTPDNIIGSSNTTENNILKSNNQEDTLKASTRTFAQLKSDIGT